MEKEIKGTNVSGSKFEDLPDNEMNKVQGQGSSDVTGETIKTVTTNIVGPVTTVTIAIKK